MTDCRAGARASHTSARVRLDQVNALIRVAIDRLVDLELDIEFALHPDGDPQSRDDGDCQSDPENEKRDSQRVEQSE